MHHCIFTYLSLNYLSLWCAWSFNASISPPADSFQLHPSVFSMFLTLMEICQFYIYKWVWRLTVGSIDWFDKKQPCCTVLLVFQHSKCFSQFFFFFFSVSTEVWTCDLLNPTPLHAVTHTQKSVLLNARHDKNIFPTCFQPSFSNLTPGPGHFSSKSHTRTRSLSLSSSLLNICGAKSNQTSRRGPPAVWSRRGPQPAVLLMSWHGLKCHQRAGNPGPSVDGVA